MWLLRCGGTVMSVTFSNFPISRPNLCSFSSSIWVEHIVLAGFLVEFPGKCLEQQNFTHRVDL